jgi:hypothetical protein
MYVAFRTLDVQRPEMVQIFLAGVIRGHQALTAPKLNGVAVNQSLGFLDCLGVVRAFQRLKPDEMAVNVYRERPIFAHPAF